MPHCDQSLYEALLRTNWNPSRLGNLLLIGNQLAEYAIKYVLDLFTLQLGSAYHFTS